MPISRWFERGDSAEMPFCDVGSVDAYREANIDLTDFVLALDPYDTNWPIWTYGEITPPAKFIHDEVTRRGTTMSSLVSGGCVVSGSIVRRSLLSTGVKVRSFGVLDGAVVLPYAQIDRSVRLTNVVIDSRSFDRRNACSALNGRSRKRAFGKLPIGLSRVSWSSKTRATACCYGWRIKPGRTMPFKHCARVPTTPDLPRYSADRNWHICRPYRKSIRARRTSWFARSLECCISPA